MFRKHILFLSKIWSVTFWEAFMDLTKAQIVNYMSWTKPKRGIWLFSKLWEGISVIIPSQQRWRGYSNAAVRGWLGE